MPNEPITDDELTEGTPGAAPATPPEAAPESANQEFAPPEEPGAQILAMGAGRGGTGKSFLAANMCVYLAQLGKRVIVVDGDPAGGTLHHMLGTPRPERGLGSLLRGRCDTLAELVVDTPVAGVRLIAGEAYPFSSGRIKASTKAVLTALRALPADIVVVDLGPPDLPFTMDVWSNANVAVSLTLSDPASIEATYRFVKSAFLRKLRGERRLDRLIAESGRLVPAALDLFRGARHLGRNTPDEDTGVALREDPENPADARPAQALPPLAASLARSMATFRPRFVVSQTRSLGDTKIGPQMASAAHRRLGHSFEYLGHLEFDETVSAAARRHRPVMAEFPEAKVCKNIERIARRILSAEADRPAEAPQPRLEEEQTFYEILETEPGVSDEEVRRAYRLFREVYAVGSPVVSGLFEDSELAALHARATAAHDTLFAPEQRRLYDLGLPASDLARAVRRAAFSPRPSAVIAAVEAGNESTAIADDEPVTGDLLRKVRVSRGLDLSDVAQRTKIGERHLRSIEEEKFDELPAPVYVRGFVAQYARVLKIDAARAVEQYLRRFHGVNGPGSGTPILKEL